MPRQGSHIQLSLSSLSLGHDWSSAGVPHDQQQPCQGRHVKAEWLNKRHFSRRGMFAIVMFRVSTISSASDKYTNEYSMASSSDTALATFGTAFERLNSSISRDDARLFQSTTVKDVWEAARGIECHLEASGKLRRLRRIEPFLVSLEQYSKVIEVICNGTPYLPYIWVSVAVCSFH